MSKEMGAGGRFDIFLDSICMGKNEGGANEQHESGRDIYMD